MGPDKKIYRDNIIKSHYLPRIDKYEENFKILDWEDRISQIKRFNILVDNVDLNNRTILDVGCGIGDLYDFLKKTDVSVDYTGIDILDQMIERARECNPYVDFRVMDIFHDGGFASDSFDVVFASGIFNLDHGNNMDYLFSSIRVLMSITRKHLVFNLLSDKSQDKEEKYYYYSKKRVLDKIDVLCRKTKTIDGYLQNDFSVICSK